jgi:hypothetical protein
MALSARQTPQQKKKKAAGDLESRGRFHSGRLFAMVMRLA